MAVPGAGGGAVFVSHDQKDALAVSDQIVVLQDGALAQQGTPREIYQYPAGPFVAGFVGKSNIFPGTVSNDENIIETLIGPVPCFHNHGARPGKKVLLSVRPDSFELCEYGGVRGHLVKAVFVGNAVEAVISAEGMDGTRVELQVHIHPEKDVRVGDTLQFKVLPDFVAVID